MRKYSIESLHDDEKSNLRKIVRLVVCERKVVHYDTVAVFEHGVLT